MLIAVLVKPVPDAAGGSRLLPDFRLDRSGVEPTINPNDAHAIEAAVRLVESRDEGEVVLVSMAPLEALEPLRRGLAIGASRGVLVVADSLAGACTLTTARVLAAAIERLDPDYVLAGADSADARAGLVPSTIAGLGARLCVTMAADLALDADGLTVHRPGPGGDERIAVPQRSVVSVTQAVGQPRYPSLRAQIAAKTKPIDVWSTFDIGIDDAVATYRSTSVQAVRAGRRRNEPIVVSGPPTETARVLLDFLQERGFGL